MSIVSKFPKKDKKKKNREWSENLLILPVILFIMLLVLAVAMFVNLEDVEEKEVPELKAEPIQVVVEIPAADVEEQEPEIVPKEHLTDKDLMAITIMAEAGSEEMIGKVAVASVILNRCDYYGMTVESVLNQPNQFQTEYYGIITEDCYRAVEIAEENRDLFPETMLFFRNKHYHSFGEPYMVIGNHYFSLTESEE